MGKRSEGKEKEAIIAAREATREASIVSTVSSCMNRNSARRIFLNLPNRHPLYV